MSWLGEDCGDLAGFMVVDEVVDWSTDAVDSGSIFCERRSIDEVEIVLLASPPLGLLIALRTSSLEKPAFLSVSFCGLSTPLASAALLYLSIS